VQSIIDQLTNAEFMFGDFLLPWGMVIASLGFLAAWLIVIIMERLGWTRFIWHLPLFFVALSILLGCIFGLVLSP